MDEKDKNAQSRKSARNMPEHTTLIMSGLRKISAKAPGETPFIGHLPIEKQYMLTLGAALGLIVLAASLVTYSTIQVGNKTEYIGTSTEMQMLSQRIAKGAQQAVQGNVEAFKQLKGSRVLYNDGLSGLVNGNGSIPASPRSIQPLLTHLEKDWKPIAGQIDLILGQEKTLVGLHKNVGNINKSSNEKSCSFIETSSDSSRF